MGFLTVAWGIAKKIPAWLYIAVLAVLLILHYKHEIVVWRNKYTLLKAENADAVIEKLKTDLAISNKRNDDLSKEITDASARTQAITDHAAALSTSLVRVSGALASVKQQYGSSSNSTAASDLATTRKAIDLFTVLLGERQRADATRGSFADGAYDAAIGCGRQYNSVKSSQDAASAAGK